MPSLLEAGQQLEQQITQKYPKLSTNNADTWNSPAPLSPDDVGKANQPSYMTPEEWDWRSAELGPNNEKRVKGQVGWTPHGTRYFGGANALQEWWNGLNYNVIQKPKKPKRDEQGEIVNEYGAGYALRVAGRALLEGVKLFGVPATAAERGINVLTSTPDAFLDDDERFMGNTRWFEQDAGFWKNTANMLSTGAIEISRIPYEWAKVGQKILDGKITKEDIGREAEMQWQGGRIAYSMWSNEAVKHEYEKRYLAGENPYLLAEELGILGPEFVGQFALDPLNFVGIGLLDETRHVSKTKNLMTRVLPKTQKIFDKIADADKVLDIAKSQDLIVAISDDFADVAKATKKIVEDRGLWGLTQNAKREFGEYVVNNYTRKLTEMFTTKDAAGKVVVHTDDFLDAVKSLIMLHSDNADEVTMAVAELQGMASHPQFGATLEGFLSEGAAQFGVFAREFMTDADGVVRKGGDFAQAISEADTPEKLLELSNKLMGKSINKMFPSMQQLAERGEDLGVMGNFILNSENIANSAAMKAINGTFARMYMGMSPGYAMRNMLTNSVHLLFDGGVGTFIGKDLDGKLKWFGPKANRAALEKFFGGKIPDEILQGMGQVGEKFPTKLGKIFDKITGGTLELGAKFETNAAMSIYANEIRNLNRAFLQPDRALASVDDLLAKGFSQEVVDTLLRHSADTFGDIDGAINTVIAGMEKGSMPLLDTMNHISPDQVRALSKYNLYDPLRDAIRGISDGTGVVKADELERAIREVFESVDVEKIIASDIQNYPFIGTMDAGHHGESVAFFGQSGSTHEYSNIAYQHQMTANFQADDAVRNIAYKARQSLLNLGMTEDDIYATFPHIESIANRSDGGLLKIANQKHTQFANNFNDIVTRVKKGEWTIEQGWEAASVLIPEMKSMPAPSNVSPDMFGNFMWDGVFRPHARGYWRTIRETQAGQVDEFLHYVKSTLEMNGSPVQHLDVGISKVKTKLAQARRYDKAIWSNAKDAVGNTFIGDAIDDYDDVLRLATLNGYYNIKGSNGWFYKLRRLVNTYAKENGLPTIKKIEEANFDTVFRALEADRGEDFVKVWRTVTDDVPALADEALETVGGALDEVAGETRLLATPLPKDGNVIPARHMYGDDGEVANIISTLRDDVISQSIEANGKMIDVPKNEAGLQALEEWGAVSRGRVVEARNAAIRLAKEKRDFALINYADRRHIDTLTSFVFPYHFWHSRTMNNWAKRVAQDPKVLANYVRYKETLEKEHAGMPEWWRYNVNTNELFGLDMDNPLYLNLEATLNPLNGLLGVDFDDPHKRVDNFSGVLMDLGTFGPSTHTMLSIMNAFRLKIKGEDEAASRWGGRLIPQTQSLGALQSLIERGIPEEGALSEVLDKSGATGLQDALSSGLGDNSLPNVSTLDPLTQLFSGGVDPYTARRVDRALVAMIQDGVISEEQAIDAATERGGEIYEAALERAINARAPGQLMSFLFGVGFKPRTKADMATDQFFEAQQQLWNSRAVLSPDEFNQAMSQVKQQYPFGEMLLIGRQGGDERDTALAYHVLNRVPPGQSELLREMGLDQRVVSQFYENKGTEFMTESDRQRFMSAVIDLSAVLAIPDNSSRQEWDIAKQQYKSLQAGMQQRFGEDILELVDGWYGAENRDAYLQQFPIVEQAMDWRAEQFATNPTSLLTTYYGGFDKIENYYRGAMYNALDEKYGADFSQVVDGYYALGTSQERKAYLNANPQLRSYWDDKAEWQEIVNREVAKVGSLLPDVPTPEIRPDADLSSVGAQDLMLGVQAQQRAYQTYTIQDWTEKVTLQTVQYALGALQGQELTSIQRSNLDFAAKDMGLSNRNQLIQYIGQSYLRSQRP